MSCRKEDEPLPPYSDEARSSDNFRLKVIEILGDHDIRPWSDTWVGDGQEYYEVVDSIVYAFLRSTKTATSETDEDRALIDFLLDNNGEPYEGQYGRYYLERFSDYGWEPEVPGDLVKVYERHRERRARGYSPPTVGKPNVRSDESAEEQ